MSYFFYYPPPKMIIYFLLLSLYLVFLWPLSRFFRSNFSFSLIKLNFFISSFLMYLSRSFFLSCSRFYYLIFYSSFLSSLLIADYLCINWTLFCLSCNCVSFESGIYKRLYLIFSIGSFAIKPYLYLKTLIFFQSFIWLLML